MIFFNWCDDPTPKHTNFSIFTEDKIYLVKPGEIVPFKQFKIYGIADPGVNDNMYKSKYNARQECWLYNPLLIGFDTCKGTFDNCLVVTGQIYSIIRLIYISWINTLKISLPIRQRQEGNVVEQWLDSCTSHATL